jgi:excisionase family DNA binding protein
MENKLRSGNKAEGGGRHEPYHIGDYKLCYTVPEVAQLLGVSRNFRYELERRGEIPVIKLGNRMRVPKVKFHEKFGYFQESVGVEQ